jgi:ATP synthase F1 gamma subunit
MQNIAWLKQDMEFSRGFEDIVDVLKTAVLIQFRAVQEKEKINAEYLGQVEECFSHVDPATVKHAYLAGRQDLPTAYVAVTSDEGFLGELNSLLINTTIDKRDLAAHDRIFVLGERGARYLEDMNEKFSFFAGISDDVRYEEAQALRNFLLAGYHTSFGKIVVVYPEFVSLTVQRIRAYALLPYAELDMGKKAGPAVIEDMLFEPDSARVVEALIELWMGIKLLEIFWSSKQSEYAARIMHLDGSMQELKNINTKLSYEYFRQAHALKDNAIREITASRVLLTDKR